MQQSVLPKPLLSQNRLIVLAWSSVAVVAVIQSLAVARVTGADTLRAVAGRLAIVPLWALATPLILRSARRWPVIGTPASALWRHVALHIALGSLFIVVANFVIEVPWQTRAGDLVRLALADIAENYPAALVVYLVIVALGHVRRPAPASAIRSDCLTVRQWNRTHFVRLEDIDWIEAADNYVVVHAAGRSYKTRERLSEVEKALDSRFVRVHRSTIVQVSKIRELQPLTHGDHAVILRDGTLLRASRARRAVLEEALGIQL